MPEAFTPPPSRTGATLSADNPLAASTTIAVQKFVDPEIDRIGHAGQNPMSESDHLLAAIGCCGARAKIAQGKLDQFTLIPSDASSERTYRKLKEDWREATEHAEHLRRRLGRFQWREAAE